MEKRFGERLRELREAKGLNQAQLAGLFHVSKQTISAWEKDLQETDFDTLIKLADFFDVTVDYILGIEK